MQLNSGTTVPKSILIGEFIFQIVTGSEIVLFHIFDACKRLLAETAKAGSAMQYMSPFNHTIDIWTGRWGRSTKAAANVETKAAS